MVVGFVEIMLVDDFGSGFDGFFDLFFVVDFDVINS